MAVGVEDSQVLRDHQEVRDFKQTRAPDAFINEVQVAEKKRKGVVFLPVFLRDVPCDVVGHLVAIVVRHVDPIRRPMFFDV